MEDLKVENSRLQKMVDVLDSQPDLVLCVNGEGSITYISERTRNFIKIDELTEEDPSHVNQILAPESMEVFVEAISQLKQSHAYAANNQQNVSMISAVKVRSALLYYSSLCTPNIYAITRMCFVIQEVTFQDSNGYPTIGYLRCSKIIRKPQFEDPEAGENDSNAGAAPAKKARKGDTTAESSSHMMKAVSSTSISDVLSATLEGAIALQALTGQPIARTGSENSPKSSSTSSTRTPPVAETADAKASSKYNSGSDANTSEDSNKTDQPPMAEEDLEDEYVCVIRPADASIPPGSSISFQTYLSTASMVEHDRRDDRQVQRASSSSCNNLKKTRAGSPTGSLSNEDSGSEDKLGSHASGNRSSDTKLGTGTSSETGSERDLV